MLVEAKTWLLALAMITPRAFVCLAILPGFGTRTLTGFAKNAVSMCIALPAVVPTYYAIQQTPPDLLLGGMIALKEAALGVVFGALLAIPLWVIQSVGTIFDQQRTPVQVTNTNASQDQDASATGALLLQAAMLVMIEAGLYINFARVLLESYAAWPVMDLGHTLFAHGMPAILPRFGQLMSYIILYAAPLLLPFLLIELSFGMVGIAAPNLQVSQLAAPVKCVVGTLVLVMYWATLSHYVADDFARQLGLVQALYGHRGQ